MRKITGILVLLMAGCVGQEPESGAQIYQAECAACHGVDARGAGSFGRQLITEPPDLTGLAAGNGGVFPRDYVLSVVDGFEREPHFSGAMPEFGAGDMGEVVVVELEEGVGTPVPERLLAVVEWLESVQVE